MSENSLVRDQRFEDVKDRFEKMQKREFEFAQSRSSFQIEKFIGMDEFTDISKFRLLSHNSYALMKNVKDMLISREKVLRKIDRLQQKLSNDSDASEQDYDLEIYKLQCSLDDIEIQLKGSMQEIEVFEKLCDKLEEKNGKPFTYKDFEKDQPNYWKLRIANQMHKNQAARKFGISEGNYETFLQALESPILEDSINVIEPLPIGNSEDVFNILSIISLKDRENINTKLLATSEDK